MGNKILMIETNFMGIGIDSPKDLALAKKYLEKKLPDKWWVINLSLQ